MDPISLFVMATIIIAVSTILVYPVVKTSWMENISRFLIISLPFERIPSIDIAGVSIRASQLLVLFGFWVLSLLLIKGEQNILNQKIKKINYYLLAFLVFSIPSFFFVINERRFLTTMIATLIAFGATFLISQFEQNPFQRIKEVSISILIAAIFGGYQFIGDMIGLPTRLTGLRAQYTKEVFGIPRIQGTALEPLYFAGMLFLPIIAAMVFTASKKRLIPVIKKLPSFLTNNLAVFIFLSVIFLGTNSKAAILILVFIIFALLLFLMMRLDIKKLVNKISILISILAVSLTGVIFYIPRIRESIELIIFVFWNTFFGRGASVEERLAFLETFNKILPDFIVTGIGSGQFGPRAVEFIPFLDATGNITAIVNNVYLEVWLEFGIIAAIIFVTMILWLIWSNLPKLLSKKSNWKTQNNMAKIILTFSLISYSIQWLTFSPIFIMPIFIIIGMLSSID